jgi:hypothetical protein
MSSANLSDATLTTVCAISDVFRLDPLLTLIYLHLEYMPANLCRSNGTTPELQLYSVANIIVALLSPLVTVYNSRSY